MKVTIQVVLEGGIELSAAADVATLADVRKLGAKLVQLPAGANKLMPGLNSREVKAIQAMEGPSADKGGAHGRR